MTVSSTIKICTHGDVYPCHPSHTKNKNPFALARICMIVENNETKTKQLNELK